MSEEELKKVPTEEIIAELDQRDANPLTEFRRAGGRVKGAAKARTSEQARTAVHIRWHKTEEEKQLSREIQKHAKEIKKLERKLTKVKEVIDLGLHNLIKQWDEAIRIANTGWANVARYLRDNSVSRPALFHALVHIHKVKESSARAECA